jgi:tRNA-splicing ligase RtcB
MNIYGTHDEKTVEQLKQCVEGHPDARAVLCADGHLGYSMPIGGVVAYPNHVSPSGVGYDIACGNLAVKTSIRAIDVTWSEYQAIADEIQRVVSFGVGRSNAERIDDHPVFDLIAESPVKTQRTLLDKARNQLGTVGSGNHYVDVLEDTDGFLWVACHFGSRGFGHGTANMFMNAAVGKSMTDRAHEGEMMSAPLLIPADSPLGQDYIAAMNIAGEYAYAGRRWVVQRVLSILGDSVRAMPVDVVHNHHNFAWRETHDGVDYWVHRKGATPAGPGVRGFIGGSMGDVSVIVHGAENVMNAETLRSTVHGAGRVMSRNAALKGKHVWMCEVNRHGAHPIVPKTMRCDVCNEPLTKVQITEPIDFDAVRSGLVDHFGVVLRGAGADESPQVYRSLESVLAAHEPSIEVDTRMFPRIVVMAGKDCRDPYKD